MEYDRFSQSRELYLLGLISLLLGLMILAFCFYILPAIWFGWRYEIPEFLAHLAHWLQLHYALGVNASYYLIFVVFLLIGLMGLLMAWIASTRIDKMILAHELPAENEGEMIDEATKLRRAERYRATSGLVFKVFFIILLAFVLISVIEWLIYVPPPL